MGLVGVRIRHDHVIETESHCTCLLQGIVEILGKLEKILLNLQTDSSLTGCFQFDWAGILGHDLESFLSNVKRAAELISEETDPLLDGAIDLILDSLVDPAVEIHMITGKALPTCEVMGTMEPELHHPHEANVLQHHHFGSNITHNSLPS